SSIFGSCVVLPEPVAPATMTTWWSRIASMMSSRRWLTGRSSGYVTVTGRAAVMSPPSYVAALCRRRLPHGWLEMEGAREAVEQGGVTVGHVHGAVGERVGGCQLAGDERADAWPRREGEVGLSRHALG